jgi:cytochrome c5
VLIAAAACVVLVTAGCGSSKKTTETKTAAAPAAVDPTTPVSAPRQPGPQGRVYDSSKQMCADAGRKFLGAGFGGRSIAEIAKNYAKANYGPKLRLSAARGCIDGLS